jgi:sugar lactone lactonase YvrE
MHPPVRPNNGELRLTGRLQHHEQKAVPALLAILLVVMAGRAAAAEAGLFVSRPVSPAGEYTSGIEGPAVDANGALYVVNFRKAGTVGVIRPGTGRSELFLELPAGSIGNAIRFDGSGRMYIADYRGHTVFAVERGEATPRIHFRSDRFHQPNDLTVAPDGALYASDPDWRRRAGQIWRITRGADGKSRGADGNSRGADGNSRGEVMGSPRAMGTTNGIDLSPDGRTLYAGESGTREIWAYGIDGARLTVPRLVRRFADFDIDGLRTDIDGRLFVARITKGTVAVLSPEGDLIREIPLNGREPTNLAFGGPDGRTVFVTQRQGGFVEAFRVERPGREYCLQLATDAATACAPAAISPPRQP